MIWDRIFWVWYLVLIFFLAVLLMEDFSLVNIIFGALVAGLGFAKLAEESGRKESPKKAMVKVSRKLLKKLEG